MARKSMGRAILAASLLAIFSGQAIAALPFITDDAGTVEKGVTQVELWYAGATDTETVSGSSVKTEENLPGATLGLGVADTVDLTFGFARVWGGTTVDGVTSSDTGSADFLVNMKWRFYETSGLAFAVKPAVGYSYLVGGASDEETTLYGGWLIATKEERSGRRQPERGVFLPRLPVGGGAECQQEQHLECFGPGDVRDPRGMEAGTGRRGVYQSGQELERYSGIRAGWSDLVAAQKRRSEPGIQIRPHPSRAGFRRDRGDYRPVLGGMKCLPDVSAGLPLNRGVS